MTQKVDIRFIRVYKVKKKFFWEDKTRSGKISISGISKSLEVLESNLKAWILHIECGSGTNYHLIPLVIFTGKNLQINCFTRNFLSETIHALLPIDKILKSSKNSSTRCCRKLRLNN